MIVANDVLLIVNPDRPARERLGQALERAGYRVLCVESVVEGRRAIERYGPPGLVVVSLRLAEATKPVLCHAIHLAADVPVVAIADHAFHAQAAHALEACADDFIAWPASDEEIVARVRRVLRQTADNAYRLARDSRAAADARVALPGEWAVPPGLSERETALWSLLRRHEGRVLSAEFLLSQVWPAEPVGEGTLRVAIHRLRQKLNAAAPHAPAYGAQISSVRGRGYLYTDVLLRDRSGTTYG